MALFITATFADFLRNCIRRCRLPAPLNILFFGFDRLWPEEGSLLSTADQPKTRPSAVRIAPPRRHRPQTTPISLDEIGQRIEAWAAGLETFPPDIIMDELAARNQLHKNHLSKYFLHIGKDFRRWKLEKKVECASRLLLRYPDAQVGEIATRAGFGNTSNFFRQFNRLTGCTPKQWRKRNNPGGPD